MAKAMKKPRYILPSNFLIRFKSVSGSNYLMSLAITFMGNTFVRSPKYAELSNFTLLLS